LLEEKKKEEKKKKTNTREMAGGLFVPRARYALLALPCRILAVLSAIKG
jgi:hypothetical protein